MFKVGDVVYYIDEDYSPGLETPRKGTIWESIGIVIDADSFATVRWSSGAQAQYADSSLRHKHRVKMFFRDLKAVIKIGCSDLFRSLQAGLSGYLTYRRFKKGDIVCLKQSTHYLSTCDPGKIIRKKHPYMYICWKKLDYSKELATSIEHYNDTDPNRSFKTYKRSLS